MVSLKFSSKFFCGYKRFNLELLLHFCIPPMSNGLQSEPEGLGNLEATTSAACKSNTSIARDTLFKQCLTVHQVIHAQFEK